jgi:hypothetical protein
MTGMAWLSWLMPPVLAGTAFALYQLVHMGRHLDLHTLAIVAYMLGQDGGAIEHAHPLCIGQHRVNVRRTWVCGME